ncbi:MAG: MjaI family restriction endonuclease [Porphyromonas sp.]|nr:MjaI family restriction endonuclease [Porphyromonas sp.]
MEKHSMSFGKKERVLNYACQTYQLSRPNKVGEVMALIRECQPSTLEEWRVWYFDNAFTKGKQPTKISETDLEELGERLYVKIKEVVMPEWIAAFNELTKQDCIDYIYNLTINRTYDGYEREKSVVSDGLAKLFPKLIFEESDPELDHAGDVDYVAKVGERAIGIQIKPVTSSANFGGYSLSERMQTGFSAFKEKYGGRVFVVYSLDGEIANREVIEDIREELHRLSEMS